MSTTQHSTRGWPGAALQRDFMHSEVTGKASATCSLAATGEPALVGSRHWSGKMEAF